MSDPLSHPLLETLMQGAAIGAEDVFGFACRGCGHLCCTNKTVLVAPPEALRIQWRIARNNLPQRRWGQISLGGSTGLPVVSLRFDDPGRRCVFSRTVRVRGRTVGALCTIRDARPGPCRIYPLGRAQLYHIESLEFKSEYRIVEHCPGFDPNAEEGVPELKQPAPEGQTVSAWLAGQLQPEVETEKQFYLERVIAAFMARRLHAPTEDNPAGGLPKRLALALLGPMFYPTLRAPEEPGDDHKRVMQWLASLVEAAERIAHRLASLFAEQPGSLGPDHSPSSNGR